MIRYRIGLWLLRPLLGQRAASHQQVYNDLLDRSGGPGSKELSRRLGVMEGKMIEVMNIIHLFRKRI